MQYRDLNNPLCQNRYEFEENVHLLHCLVLFTELNLGTTQIQINSG